MLFTRMVSVVLEEKVHPAIADDLKLMMNQAYGKVLSPQALVNTDRLEYIVGDKKGSAIRKICAMFGSTPTDMEFML